MKETPNWLKVTEAKVSYVVFTKKDRETGEKKPCSLPNRLGVKITLGDGTWYFYHFRYESWTQHTPGNVKCYASGTPMTDPQGNVLRHPERIARWDNDFKFRKAFAHCPKLIAVIEAAYDQAIAEDEEKQAA